MRLIVLVFVLFTVLTRVAPAATGGVPTAAAQERTAQWLFEHGRVGEARTVAQQRLAISANDAEALTWLARTQTASGDAKGAVATAERAIAAHPKYAAAHLALAEALSEEARDASMLRQLPLARRIKKSLETATALEPNNIDALNGLMQFYAQAPGVAGGSGEKADAIAVQIAALDVSRGFLAQAALAARRKHTERVEGLYLKAVEADGNSLSARLAIASLYANDTSRQAEAETHSRAALALDPDRVTPYRVLAIVYARAQRWNDLDAILAQADRRHPSNLTAWYAAAQTLEATGADLPRAERYLRRYLAQPPEIGAPSHALAYWRLGLVLEKSGRLDEARAAVRQAVRMNPNLERAKKDLKRLGGLP